MSITHSEQFELYRQLFELENGEIDLEDKENKQKLANFIKEKRRKINELLNEKWANFTKEDFYSKEDW